MDCLLIGNPSSDRRLVNTAAQLVAHSVSGKRRTIHMEYSCSTPCYNFNQLWVAALNLRATKGVTHFLLWHADIRPLGADWLDTLFDEMAINQADVLSAIVPIKDERGLTSTAFDLGNWQGVRLSQKQVWSKAFPDTWTADNLLANTGLMLVDMRHPWVEKICFTINDRIVFEKGQWKAQTEPEDWNFSKQCHALGVKLFVTRKVVTEHHGSKAYRSDEIWGQAVDHEAGATEQHFAAMEVADVG